MGSRWYRLFRCFQEQYKFVYIWITAEVFDPDRFLDERLQKYLIPNPFIFVPFHAGPRICLGQQVGTFFKFNSICH